MNNGVVCVYQDCPLCGDRGKKVQEIVADKGVNLRKVSFASPEGRELIFRAMSEHGIKTMPFYVMDGRFSTEVEEVLEPVEKPVKIDNLVTTDLEKEVEEKLAEAVEAAKKTVVEKPKKRVRKINKKKEAKDGVDK